MYVCACYGIVSHGIIVCDIHVDLFIENLYGYEKLISKNVLCRRTIYQTVLFIYLSICCFIRLWSNGFLKKLSRISIISCVYFHHSGSIPWRKVQMIPFEVNWCNEIPDLRIFPRITFITNTILNRNTVFIFCLFFRKIFYNSSDAKTNVTNSW